MSWIFNGSSLNINLKTSVNYVNYLYYIIALGRSKKRTSGESWLSWWPTFYHFWQLSLQEFLVTIDQFRPSLTTFYEISWHKWLTMLIIIMIMVVSDREGVLLLHHPPLSIVLRFQFYVLFERKIRRNQIQRHIAAICLLQL